MTDDASSQIGVACAALHTDGEGNIIPCPGYPHEPGQQIADAVEADDLAEARRLLAADAEARAAACGAEIQAVLDKYGMQLEISTPAVTISPKP